MSKNIVISGALLVTNHLVLTCGFIMMVLSVTQGSWTWSQITVSLVTFSVAMIGVSVGWHRYGVHKAFEFKGFIGHWLIRPILLLAGCQAWQSHFLWWCAVHQAHHQSSDDHDDPHGPVETLKEFLVVQFGVWIPFAKPNLERYVELRGSDKLERLIGTPLAYLLFGPFLGLSIAYWVAGLGGIWWYLGAVFCAWHITQSVNSVTHLGHLFQGKVTRRLAPLLTLTRPHQTGGRDSSVNSWLIALISAGEGWHNNHHHAPRSARFGQKWWQIDLGWYFILLLKILGIVKLPQSSIAK